MDPVGSPCSLHQSRPSSSFLLPSLGRCPGPLPGSSLAARLSQEWSFTPLTGRRWKPVQSPLTVSPQGPGCLPPIHVAARSCPAAFVPAPPVAPVPAPAPMPPVHPPPPMEDEPASKKLKTEDSLMPEEEFLRRNKACDPELPTLQCPDRSAEPSCPLHALAHPELLPWFWLLGPRSAAGGPGGF